MKPKEKSNETLTMARLEETSIALHRFSIVLAVVVFFGAMTLQGTYDPVGKAIKAEQQRMQLQQAQTVCNCETTADNCQMLCKKHNRKKSDK